MVRKIEAGGRLVRDGACILFATLSFVVSVVIVHCILSFCTNSNLAIKSVKQLPCGKCG
jgi:hypothetical protein